MTLRRSLFFSMAQRYVSLVLTLAVTMLSARLLDPLEFGAFAIAQAVIGFAVSACGFGVDAYIIQVPRLTRAHLNTAFSILLAVSFTVAGSLYMLRGAIAAFFETEVIATLLAVMLISLLLYPFNTVRVSYLLRRMEFKTLMIVGIVGTAALVFTSSVLLLLGVGVISLAFGSLAEAVAITAMVNYRITRRSRIRLSLAGAAEIARFGAPVMGERVLTTSSAFLPLAIIGRLISIDAAGYFNRTMAVFNLFERSLMQGVRPVIMPAFAEIKRSGRDIGRAWADATSSLSVFAWPLFLALVLLSRDFVRVLFGDQWDAIVPLVRVICIGGLAYPVITISLDMLKAVGQVWINFVLQAGYQAAVVVFTVVLSWFGLFAVVVGIAVASLGYAVALTIAICRIGALGPKDLWRSYAPTLLATAATIAPVAALVATLEPGDMAPLVVLLVAFLLGCVGWLIALWAGRHLIWEDVRASGLKIIQVVKG